MRLFRLSLKNPTPPTHTHTHTPLERCFPTTGRTRGACPDRMDDGELVRAVKQAVLLNVRMLMFSLCSHTLYCFA